MRTLYPAIDADQVLTLNVDPHHRIRVETCGNPNGVPVVFLHGGPGSGCKPYHRSFFDPDRYRIVLIDQRGAGRSTPTGELTHNTTTDLLADLEHTRSALGIERWVLFGGSWGAALALLYAQTYPERVMGMVLRGSFLARARDLAWYLVDGANRLFPERWHALSKLTNNPVPECWADEFFDILRGNDEVARLRLAKAWSAWGAQLTLGNDFDPAELENRSPASFLHQVRIELHYARNRYFLAENQVVDGLDLMPRVPTVIVHGRYDLVCPPEAAYLLNQRIPGSELRIVPTAGHAAGSPDMIDALVTATDDLLQRLAS
jgi:proline iminopeptidase